MPSKTGCVTNPFATPIKTSDSSTPSITDADITPRQPNILATANLLLEQVKDLEALCSTVEERVQRKRQTLKELEKVVAESAANTEAPPSSSPAFSANTPISRRLRFKSPRLRGLFDLRGPGKANPVALQSALDYSPEPQVEAEQVVSGEEEWEDDDEEAPLCPFDDKCALQGIPIQSQLNVEKSLPAIPIDSEKDDVQTTKIPRLYLKRRVSTSKYFTVRSGPVTQAPSSKRRHSMRRAGSKPLETATSPKNLSKGTMHRPSGRRGILENVNGKTKGGARVPHVNENENARESTRRKEKRKGLWSIYSVYSELGLSGSHHTRVVSG